jgi:hypothetical protein
MKGSLFYLADANYHRQLECLPNFYDLSDPFNGR